MPLRYQFLLLALLTLFLPWAGCRYAREMESVLRDGQEQALTATASTLAAMLGGRPQLLYPDSAQPAPFDPSAGDLYGYSLRTPPLLDGYADDWGLPADALSHLAAPGASLAVDYVVALDDRSVYLLLVVADSTPLLEQTADPAGVTDTRADHVWLSLESDAGERALYLLSTNAPGLISARHPMLSSYGERREIGEPRIQAFWQPDHAGYRLEIRIPAAMAGSRLGFEVVDVAAADPVPARVGTLDPATREPRGRLLVPSTALTGALESMLPPATRVTVGDAHGWKLGEAGSVEPEPAYGDSASSPQPKWMQGFYRRVLESGQPATPTRQGRAGRLIDPPAGAAIAGGNGSSWFRLPDERRTLLAVSTPITAKGDRIGVLVLEQASDRLLTLRDRALTRLLNITFVATAVAALGLLGFAALISIRLGRLKRAAETALAPDGRLSTVIPGTGARDEVGDLARSFAVLLRRLNEYTEYLRTLAGKLSHELRTPLAIVRSSLDNLESDRTQSDTYLRRAREGTDRLQALLSAMAAATRTEEALRHAEKTRLDLAELTRSMARAYADTFKSHRFEARVPDADCTITGAAELVIQLLDKLIENAIDFAAPGATIELALEHEAGFAVLSVFNPGALISPDVRARLFDSMFQFRRDMRGQPHFGLGLHIVRLIAEFHRGQPFAENSASRGGVRVGVRFPM
jgi:dedicated sortase system histidine kinase